MMTESKAKNTPVRPHLVNVLTISFIVLSFVVLIVTQAFQFITSIQYQQAALSSKQLLIAEDASKAVSGFIDNKFGILETAIGFANPIIADTETRKTFMDSLLGADPAFRQFVLLSTSAQELAQSTRFAQTLSAQFLAQKTAALTQITANQRYISPVYIDNQTSEPLVTIALPVKNVFGDFQGSLMAEVNLKFMWDLVDQIEVGETGYAYVVDSQGNLLAFEDTGRVLAGENVSYISEVQEFIKNLDAGEDPTPEVGSYTGLTGEKVAGTYVSLGTPQWAVVVELPEQEAYRDGIRQAIYALLIFIGVILLAATIGFFAARRLARPLINLSKTATEIAGGNLSLEAEVDGPQEIAQVASNFNIMTSRLREFIGSLEQRVAERTEALELQTAELTRRSSELEEANQQSQRQASQLQLVADVTRRIATIQNVPALLQEVTSSISERFGFYHVGVFINDSASGNAVLTASNSAGGKRMLERKHSLKIGSIGIVGYVANSGKPRIALDTGEDAVFFNNPDLPGTRSEMAIPLRQADQTIGVLDVQSLEPNAFDDDDLKVLTILADQVSIALRNAYLFEESQHATAEMQALLQNYTRGQWLSVVKEQKQVGYHYKGKFQVLSEKLKPISEDSEQQDMVVPIVVRGKTIGTLKVRAPKNRKFSEDEIDIIRATTERAAIAAENARLLDESQRRVFKEQTISTITSKVGASINMRNILQTAVEELGHILAGSEVSIKLKK